MGSSIMETEDRLKTLRNADYEYYIVFMDDVQIK